MRTPDAIRQRRVSRRRRLGLRMVQGEIREEVSIARRTVVIGRTIQTSPTKATPRNALHHCGRERE